MKAPERKRGRLDHRSSPARAVSGIDEERGKKADPLRVGIQTQMEKGIASFWAKRGLPEPTAGSKHLNFY